MIRNIEIIVPLYNEYECIEELVNRLQKVTSELGDLSIESKIVLVDDGSDIEFRKILNAIEEKSKNINIINLTRNFGHQAALRAGIDSATSDAVVMLDGDLQDPPELILEMVDKWINGADSVSAVRNSRKKESLFKKVSANIYYRIFDRNANFKSTRYAGDFKLISKWMVEEIKLITEHNLYLRGFIDWLGGDNEVVFYDRDKRFGGKTRYKYRQSYNVAINGLVSLSDFFPKLLNKIFIFSIISVFFIFGWIVYTYIALPEELVKGWSSLILTILTVLILQSSSFIFLSYYIKKILDQTSGRKNYQIKGK